MKLIIVFVVFVLTIAISGCVLDGSVNKPTGPSALRVERQAQQQVASLRSAEDEGKKFLTELAAAIRAEPRNDVWATAKESELRKSYVENEAVPNGALKKIDCRRSKCEVQLELASGTPAEAKAQQMIAINQWISWSQPCSYMAAGGPAASQAPATIRVFLECSE